tara:strand:- start:682 stop:927 length:246 start_codon:yes stop_codon:yes gene_type:complete
MKRFDSITAVFQPTRTDDLKEGMQEWIGRKEQWVAQWIIEDGHPYAGEWALMPIKDEEYGVHPDFPYLWVPLCDLKIVDLT